MQLIVPGNKPTSDDEYKAQTKAIAFLHATKSLGLKFVSLDLSTARLVLMTDPSCANATGIKSQLGYVLFMTDNPGHFNIIHCGSNRCNQIARSVMAAEVQTLILGFDYSYLVRDFSEKLIGRPLSLEAMINKKTVSNVVAKDGQTTEIPLKIDVLALRQSYDKE